MKGSYSDSPVRRVGHDAQCGENSVTRSLFSAALLWITTLCVTVCVSAAEDEGAPALLPLVPRPLAQLATYWPWIVGTNSSFAAGYEFEARRHGDDESRTLKVRGTLVVANGNLRLELPPYAGRRKPKGAAAKEPMVLLVLRSLGRQYLVEETITGMAEAKLPDPGQVKVTSVDLGPETVDSHPCSRVEYRVGVGEGDKPPIVVTLWRSPEFGGVPLKVEWGQKDNSGRLVLSKIARANTPPDLFDVPKGYTHYDGFEALSLEMARRMGTQAGGKHNGPTREGNVLVEPEPDAWRRRY